LRRRWRRCVQRRQRCFRRGGGLWRRIRCLWWESKKNKQDSV